MAAILEKFYNDLERFNSLIDSLRNITKSNSKRLVDLRGLWDEYANYDIMFDSLVDNRLYNIYNYDYNLMYDSGISELWDNISRLWVRNVFRGKELVAVKYKPLDTFKDGVSSVKHSFMVDVLPADSYYWEGDEWFFYNAEDKIKLSAENYNFFAIGDKLEGRIRKILPDLITKKITKQNKWNAGNSLFGINKVVIDWLGVEKDLEILSCGELIMSKDREKSMYELIIKEQEKIAFGLKNWQVLLGSKNIDIQNVDLNGHQLVSGLREITADIDNELQIAVLGQSGSTTEARIGSYARSKVMYQITDNISYYDLSNIEKVCNDILQENFLNMELKVKYYDYRSEGANTDVGE